MEIQNKNILITGAASGLGQATAMYLAAKHAKVILLDKNPAATALAAELNGHAFIGDITSEAFIQDTLSACDDIHAVVNCAGIVHGARIVGKNGPLPLADFSRVLNINVVGTFNVMRLSAAKMAQQNPLTEEGERGVIINTASIAAFEGQLGQVAYSASKGAIHAMTLPAARELSQFGIRVMTIAPGIMQTPMATSLPEAVQKSLSEQIPFPKHLGNPEVFAQLVSHIIENTYLNGSTIRLDGALRLG